MKKLKIEFFVTPDGKIMYDEVGDGMKELTIRDQELCEHILGMLEKLFPNALFALDRVYEASKLNRRYYNFIRVSRFIRCNFGRFDGQTFDIDGETMHIEEISCPIRCECSMAGIICKPRPLGLSPREAQIAKLIGEGNDYKEISRELGIHHSTIKNAIQNIKFKLKLSSSKDIAKVIVALLPLY